MGPPTHLLGRVLHQLELAHGHVDQITGRREVKPPYRGAPLALPPAARMRTGTRTSAASRGVAVMETNVCWACDAHAWLMEAPLDPPPRRSSAPKEAHTQGRASEHPTSPRSASRWRRPYAPWRTLGGTPPLSAHSAGPRTAANSAPCLSFACVRACRRTGDLGLASTQVSYYASDARFLVLQGE
jgi:hypothetical protein